MQRYFINKDMLNLNNNTAIIEGSDYHHIKDVMRMKVNDKVILCDNMNSEYLAQIDDLNQKVTLTILETKINNNELKADITIAQGLVRKDKIEEVLRRICELGSYGYLNVQMERCNISLKKKEDYKITRLETIVKEACEQSERGRLLKVFGYYSFKDFIKFSNDYDIKLVCYENSGRDNKNNLYDYLKEFTNKKVLILVGPEGGISNNEIDILTNNGFKLFGLGKRILRTETAPLMAMSIISGYLDYLGEDNE